MHFVVAATSATVAAMARDVADRPTLEVAVAPPAMLRAKCGGRKRTSYAAATSAVTSTAI
jgi:hypothetical protein